MKYRPEIDGLRAIAVIAVIIFHAGFNSFGGGFVGVDVFFVISGYLITTIILTEMEKGHFSLVTFYERRLRRILPALTLVLMGSLVYAWFRLLPVEMKEFSQSLVAVATFSSNIFFWQTSGYWETASELKPLLHMWSLAVEEQYYVLFPLFLMLMWRFRARWIFISFMLITGLSLAAAQWGAYNKPIAAFYLLPTRAWELGIGAGIAFLFLYRLAFVQNLIANKMLCDIMAMLGVAMIGYAVLYFSEDTPFPGYYALLPTLGTGLIIFFSSSQTLVGRLLSVKPLVSVGLISYSAYLWHQPLFAFTRLQSLSDPSGLDLLPQTLMTFALAYLSWKYVEGFFRDKSKIGRTSVFIFSFISSIMLIGLGQMGVRTEGFENRITAEQERLMAFENYDFDESYRKGSCQLTPEQNSGDFFEVCFPSITDSNTILIWGDSHAAALSYGFRELHPNLIQLTSAGCRPLTHLSGEARRCRDVNAYVMEKVGDLKPGYAFLHADWIGELEDAGGFYNGLLETVLSIRAISPETKIILVGGVPQWKPSLPKIMLRLHVDMTDLEYVYSNKYDDIQQADIILKEVAQTSRVEFVSLTDMFCENKSCLSSVTLNNEYEPFAWDYGHLTRSASIVVAENIMDLIIEVK